MQTTIGSHVLEGTLVRYASGRLSETDADDLEEHMFMCEDCRLRLNAVDEQLQVGAQAVKELREEEKRRKSPQRSHWKRGPAIAWSLAFAAILICAAVPRFSRSRNTAQGPPTVVALIASRGAAQTLISHAQAGNIVLQVDASELPPLPAYKLQVVDASGREIWSGDAANVRHEIKLPIPHALPSGQYWVRLFGRDSTQLREFGLEVE